VQNICNCAVHKCFLAFDEETEENCTLLGYYAACSGNKKLPLLAAIIIQKSAVLIYFKAEA